MPSVTELSSIPTIGSLYKSGDLDPHPTGLEDPARISFPASPELNEKISFLKGDITRIPTDVIVNAANRSLLGGGGVDGAIHSAAGSDLLKACRKLGGCQTGEVKMTDAFKLPSKRIAHTVGPVYDESSSDKSEEELRSCYSSCLKATVDEGLKTIAFCSISTGVYGYPINDATHVALDVTRNFLSSSQGSSIDRVIFVTFSSKDEAVYRKLIPTYFPVEMAVRQGSSTPPPPYFEGGGGGGKIEEVQSESTQEVLK